MSFKSPGIAFKSLGMPLKSLAAIACLLLAGCAANSSLPDPFANQPPNPSSDRMLAAMISFLEGRFDSTVQAPGAGDSTPITVRHARVWPERTGEYWLYEEYSRVGSNQPFRQRLYRFGRVGEQFVGITYALPGDGKAFAGDTLKPKPLAGLNPDRLQERAGCRLIVVPSHMSIYSGGTLGKSCPGDAPGVQYETTEFSLTSSSLRVWERGFDATGNMVTGFQGVPLEMRKHTEKQS